MWREPQCTQPCGVVLECQLTAEHDTLKLSCLQEFDKNEECAKSTPSGWLLSVGPREMVKNRPGARIFYRATNITPSWVKRAGKWLSVDQLSQSFIASGRSGLTAVSASLLQAAQGVDPILGL